MMTSKLKDKWTLVPTLKQCVANMTLAFVTHQYSGAAKHVATLQWCC
jgi:hypothetical protein